MIVRGRFPANVVAAAQAVAAAMRADANYCAGFYVGTPCTTAACQAVHQFKSAYDLAVSGVDGTPLAHNGLYDSPCAGALAAVLGSAPRVCSNPMPRSRPIPIQADVGVGGGCGGGCRGGCGSSVPMPQGANPPQAGAGRGNYWADTLTEDNETRLHGANWLKMVGLNPPGTLAAPGALDGGCRGGCGGGHHPAYPGAQVFPTCTDFNDRPQGPTDETIRCADCWWVNSILPQDTSYGLGGAMEGLSHSGRRVAGFGIGYTESYEPPPPERAHYGGGNQPHHTLPPSGRVGYKETYTPPPPEKAHGGGGAQPHPTCGSPDNPCHNPGRLFGIGAPDVFSALSAAQQGWVLSALAAWWSDAGTASWYNINSGSCPGVTVGMDLTNATNRAALVGCFQAWYNASGLNTQGSAITSGGTLDQMTLTALMNLAASTAAAGGWGSASAISAGCPNLCGVSPSNQPAATTSSNTVYYVLGGVAVLALGGAAIYAVRRKKRAA